MMHDAGYKMKYFILHRASCFILHLASFKNMNWLDIVISLMILVFAFLGLRRGLINEAVSILALVGGVIAGVVFYDFAGELFIERGLVQSKAIASVGGFIAVMFGVYVLVRLIGWVLSKITGTLHLNWLDRMGGGAFGAVKGIALSFVLISALGFFFKEKEPIFTNSVLVPYINEAFSIIKETIPEDLREKLQRARELIHEKGIKAAMDVKEAERIREIFKEGKGK